MMSESNATIEKRILQAIDTLNAQNKPNIAAASRPFNVPRQLLLARWQGRQSKIGHDGIGKKLNKEQEIAVFQCLDCLDTIRTLAR